jgi:dephospho-CoA kinase
MKAKAPAAAAGRVPVIGLTGGIASGKSTVSARLAQLGAHVIDADAVGHRVLEPGAEAYEAVLREFGEEILDHERRIVRARLGALVFADAERLGRLNAISHPLMATRMAGEIAEVRARQAPPPAIVLDAAILFQAGWDSLCDIVWTVSAPDDSAVARLAARNGMPAQQARARLAAQWSNAQREARAARTLRNDGSIAQLLEQVDRLWDEFMRERNAR